MLNLLLLVRFLANHWIELKLMMLNLESSPTPSRSLQLVDWSVLVISYLTLANAKIELCNSCSEIDML